MSVHQARRLRRPPVVLAVAWLFAGCTSAILIEEPDFNDVGSTDTSVSEDTASDAQTLPPENLAPAQVRITAPADGATVTAEVVRIEGTATDDSGIASVFVAVGPNAAVPAQSDTGFRTWWVEVPAPATEAVVRAVAYDADHQVAGPEDAIRILGVSEAADNGAPLIEIVAPDDGDMPQHPTVLIEGTATDDRGVVRVEAFINGELISERTVQTDDFYATWSRPVTLIAGEANEVTFVAYDALGHAGTDTITLTGRAAVDRDPPTVEILSPGFGDTIETDTLTVEGTADDRAGVRLVRVRTGDAATDGTPIWGDFTLATTTDGWASWQATVEVNAGAQFIEARAIDVNGLAASDEITVGNVFVPEWSDEETFTLRLRDDEAPLIRMDLDREGVGEIMNEEIQREMTLIHVDPQPLLVSTLDEVKNACGTRWQQDNSNPNHNCDLTELGRSFRGPDGTWQSSAEYAMVRILTMTPANVKVEGTSIEGMQGLADFLGIGGGFSEILSDSLGIPRTHEVIGTEALVDAIQENVLATHPNTVDGGLIPVTLYDAMRDLAPLGELLGPNGEHPGLLDPDAPPNGPVLGDDFMMRIEAVSNLRWLDGLDLSEGKDYFATIVDTTGPTFEDVLEFDFTDPSRFEVTGLIPRPTVDLRFWFEENNRFVPSCAGSNTCQRNLPGSPVGTDHVWSNPEWEIESLISLGGVNQYGDRRFETCYVLCTASVEIGVGGNPAGWAHFSTPFGIGNPPQDQYVWELISEISQVALHEPPGSSIPEGQADVAFTVEDIDVGIDADTMRDAMRPYLQDQASELSDLLLGDYGGNNGAVDFYYRRGSDNQPYLFFVAPEDPRPSATYDYRAPGFYSSPELTDASRLSRTEIPGSGDSTHHKLIVGQTENVVYMEDDGGQVYRLRLDPQRGLDELLVHVSRQMR